MPADRTADDGSSNERPVADGPASTRRTTELSGPDPAAHDAAIFTAGQLVGTRYRIVRAIATGGMGEVYEAEDGELGERLALKTLRRERADSPIARDRFKRELALARKVTHPNVCRVFDVGFHRAAVEETFVPFLTMELLAGETLAERIERGGPLDPATALVLGRQMADALDAAHAVGVIHRDFKSQNVILVPAADGSLRAVVTDFGLARSTEGEPPQVGHTRTGAILGTPGYMSPEQLAGQPITPATDRYSFGIVLFEMLTGRLPLFGGATQVVSGGATTGRVPALLGARLPDGWEGIIAALLAVDPAARPPSARAALANLGAGPVAPPARSRRRALVPLLLVAAAVAGGGVLLARRARSPSDVPGDPTAARAYADGLSRLRLGDARGARALLEQVTALEPGFALGHLALSRAWRGLGQYADHAREADLAHARAAGLPAQARLEVEAGWRAAHRAWSQASELQAALVQQVPASIEHRLRLARWQVEAGRARVALATIERLRRDLPAAAADPRTALADAQASELLADYRRSGAQAAIAEPQARAAGATALVGEALLLQSYAALQLGDRPRAAALANQAHDLFQQTGDTHGVGLALRRQGRVAWKTGELARAVAAFDEAIAIFRAAGDDGELARAIQGRAGATNDLGRHAEAAAMYRTSLALYEKIGDRVGLAETHCNLGIVFQNERRLTEAEVELQRSLALARELGRRSTEAITLENLGELYYDRGDLARAVTTQEEAVALAEQIGDVTTLAQTRSKLAEDLHHQGHTARAEALFGQAIASLEGLGERGRTANAQVRLARLLLAVGRVAEAEALARRAVELHQAVGVATSESGAILARTLVAARRPLEARVAVERALRHPDELPVQTAAAEVEIAERRPRQAADRLRRALGQELPPAGEGFEAALVLGAAELAAGNRAAARARWRSVASEAQAKGFLLDARQAQDLLAHLGAR